MRIYFLVHYDQEHHHKELFQIKFKDYYCLYQCTKSSLVPILSKLRARYNNNDIIMTLFKVHVSICSLALYKSMINHIPYKDIDQEHRNTRTKQNM